MTPGQRRRRNRKWNREEHAIPCRKEFAHITDDYLRTLPHPKIYGRTAYEYVDWLVWNGHSGPLRIYLSSIACDE